MGACVHVSRRNGQGQEGRHGSSTAVHRCRRCRIDVGRKRRAGSRGSADRAVGVVLDVCGIASTAPGVCGHLQADPPRRQARASAARGHGSAKHRSRCATSRAPSRTPPNRRASCRSTSRAWSRRWPTARPPSPRRTADGAAGSVTFVVEQFGATIPVHFVNEVMPVFTKAGCNGGGCHGKSGGQNGFKLSLLGFEPTEDYTHLVHEARARRLAVAAPERSLLLTKAVNEVPHGGGKRLDAGSDDYNLLARWIRQGMPYGKETDPRVARIEVYPDEPHAAARREPAARRDGPLHRRLVEGRHPRRGVRGQRQGTRRGRRHRLAGREPQAGHAQRDGALPGAGRRAAGGAAARGAGGEPAAGEELRRRAGVQAAQASRDAAVGGVRRRDVRPPRHARRRGAAADAGGGRPHFSRTRTRPSATS